METFTFNPIESPENKPVKKGELVDILKEKGPTDQGASTLLERYGNECEARYRSEGRADARSESLREMAHALSQAGFFQEAISYIDTVIEISIQEDDTESLDEAQWIKGKLEEKIRESKPTETREEVTSNESAEKVSREEVLNAYKKLAIKAGDPAGLDRSDPEVAAAERLEQTWQQQGDVETQDDEDARLRHNFEKTMLYVDAGFHDPEYLKDVLGWLAQDAGDANKDTENPSRVALKHDMAEAMNKIRSLLGSA
ncbi:MAG: hypothetical protein QG579_15 [Patescibacteria group bacterium]|nr:hypothetical protein [Patescibacteria group bacterium]